MFDNKTEVLTDTGWKRREDIAESDSIATLNLQTKNVEFIKNPGIIEKEYAGKKVELEGTNCDGVFTDDHVSLIFSGDTLEQKYAMNLKEGMSVPVCWVWDKEDLEIDDAILKLFVWVAADGTIENTDLIRFHLKKDRKIKRLTSLLKSLKVDYTLNKQGDGTVKINMHTPEAMAGYRIKSLDEKLIQTSKRQADILVEEYLQTDGNMTSKNSFQITTSRKEEADVMQTIFVLHGYSCNILDRKKNGNQEYVLSSNTKDRCKITHLKLKNVKKESFWGFKDVKGVFVRRDGLVHITGD